MADHSIFENVRKIHNAIAEVKKGPCQLNGPWSQPEKRNMNRVMQIIGAFPQDMNDDVASSLYQNKYFEDDDFFVRLFAIGDSKVHFDEYKNVVQITWYEILEFIYDRFNNYQRFKTQHRQWDQTGQRLFELVKQIKNKNQFISTTLNYLSSD